MISNPIPWPNGARVAVAITLDMDADSLIHLSHPKDSHRRIAACSNLQYGPNVAIERILNTYRKFGLKQSFFIPGWSIENYPKVVEAIVKDGHEVGFHGYIHEHPNELSRAQEAEFMDRSIEIIKRFTGQSPKGNRAPLYNFSDNSLNLLLDRGFEYDASLMGDDVPYLISNDRGSLVEIPSSWAVDDWPPMCMNPRCRLKCRYNPRKKRCELFAPNLMRCGNIEDCGLRRGIRLSVAVCHAGWRSKS